MPKFAFNDIMLPVKLAVFPLSAKLTVKLFVILLLVTLDDVAVKLPLNVLADTTLAPVIFPPEPVIDMLPKEPLPVTSKLINVPTLVIFGCDDTVTLPA